MRGVWGGKSGMQILQLEGAERGKTIWERRPSGAEGSLCSQVGGGGWKLERLQRSEKLDLGTRLTILHS